MSVTFTKGSISLLATAAVPAAVVPLSGVGKFVRPVVIVNGISTDAHSYLASVTRKL